MQGERLQLVLGAGKQEAEGKLLWLMVAQKDKYDKWLFRVLVVLSELLVRKPTTTCNLQQCRYQAPFPWIVTPRITIETLT